jgi:hypothetical protein
MPVLTQPFGLDGPVVDLLVGVSHARQTALIALGEPVPPRVFGRFLIDTGASSTCVDPMIVRQLGIEPRDVALMHSSSTAGRPATCNTYDVSLWLPVDVNQAHPMARTMNLVEVDLRSAGAGYEGLLGREILSKCVLTCHGPRREVTLAL